MMPKIRNLKDGVTFKAKTISIRSDQEEFLKAHTLSLSRFVQQKLDELMKEKSGKN